MQLDHMIYDSRYLISRAVNWLTRTTLAIDDDVLAAARRIAACEHKSVGQVISALARQALRPFLAAGATRNGIRLLPVRPGAPGVTEELIRRFQEDLS
jgi:Arc/MetJ family transcription regulator